MAFQVLSQNRNGVTMCQLDGILFIKMFWSLKRLETGSSLWNLLVHGIRFISEEAREISRTVTEDPYLYVSYHGAHFKKSLSNFPWCVLLLLCPSYALMPVLWTFRYVQPLKNVLACLPSGPHGITIWLKT